MESLADPIRFLVLGLGAGGLFGLIGLGIVLIYRGSGVINFSHGAIGAVGTFIYWDLSHQEHWPDALAVVVAVGSTGLIGFLTYFLVMHRLRQASGLTRLIATLAVMVILQTAIALRYGAASYVVNPLLGDGALRFAGLTLGLDRLAILALTVLLTAILWLVYRFTRFGLATSAVAENRRAAEALGYSAAAIAAANWTVGAMLAGLAGILLAPITGLQAVSATLLVIPALAAALVGEMRSFPLTVVGGLAIGVGQSEAAAYVSQPGWAASIPLFVIFGVILLRGHALPVRGAAFERPAIIGSGRVDPLLVLLVLVASVIVVSFLLPIQWIDAFTTTISTAIVVLSVVLVTGYAGQLSLAQVALGGLGVVIAARLLITFHVPFELSALIGIMSGAPIGILVGLPALRTRGVNLAVVTLGACVAIQELVFYNGALTGGDFGTSVGIPTIFGYRFDSIANPASYALLTLVCFTVAALMVANIRRGATGRRLLALRGNERAAASLGINVPATKLYAFAVGAMIASLGEILISFRYPTIVFSSQFGILDSLTIVIYAVLGGVGFVAGPLIGSLLKPGGLADYLFSTFISSDFSLWLAMLGGVGVVLTLQAAPDGLFPMNARQLRSLYSWIESRFRAKARPAARLRLQLRVEPTKVPSISLDVRNLKVTFGGVTAVNDVSLALTPGEVHGLIGPNGSGKTTIIDAITGFVEPAAGSIYLSALRIDRWTAARRAGRGLGRSFQSLELFEEMTVEENLRVASERFRIYDYLTDPLWPRRLPPSQAMNSAIDEFDLSADLDRLPRELPYGKRRLVAVARTVASMPSVLLLDEPGAGLSDQEKAVLGRMIQGLAQHLGMAVLFVEHDVDLIMKTCDRITVLETGRVIATGAPNQIRHDSAVIRAYLGETRGAAKATT